MRKEVSHQSQWNSEHLSEYFKNVCSNRLENLEEIGKFLDACDLTKLTNRI
jgi:hypothetical protein